MAALPGSVTICCPVCHRDTAFPIAAGGPQYDGTRGFRRCAFLHHLHRIEAAMTSPVTTASVPYPLKQGVKRPTPAKQAPAHKTAAAKAAAATKQARGK